MKKIILITFVFTFAVLINGLSKWLDDETEKIKMINSQHQKEIKKLKKINKINQWLTKKVQPFIDSLPRNEKLSNQALISFFDNNMKKYNFKVEKYLYKEKGTQNLDIAFNIQRDKKQLLESFMALKFEKGYKHFNLLKIRQKNVEGVLKLVQPINTDLDIKDFEENHSDIPPAPGEEIK